MPVPPEVPHEMALQVPDALQRELRQIAVLGITLLAATAISFSILLGPALGLRWLAAALICWAFVLWQCHKRLHLNHGTVNGRLYTTLGHGNCVTLLRGLLIAATAGFLALTTIESTPWLLYVAAALYTMAAMGDWLDGQMARRQQQTTQLGTELDTALDALGLLIAPLLAVLYGKLHVSYLLVSIAYYLFQWGIHWRRRHSRPVYPLPPSQLRRHLAGLQMALVAFVLWPALPAGLTRALGLVLMIPLLLGFCRDWLHVSGRLGTDRRTSA